MEFAIRKKILETRDFSKLNAILTLMLEWILPKQFSLITDEELKRRMKVFAVASWYALIIYASEYVLFYKWNAQMGMIGLEFAAIFILIAMLFSRLGYHGTARIVMHTSVAFFIIWNAVFVGYETYIWIYMIPATSAIFLMFGSEEKLLVRIMSVFLLLLWLIWFIVEINSLVPVEYSEILKSEIRNFKFMTIGSACVIQTLMVWIFHRQTILFQERIKQQSASLIKQEKFSALGVMAAGVAHEINNPLMVIDLRTEMISKKFNEEAIETTLVKSYVDNVVKSSHRIAKIVKGLRVITREEKQDPFQIISIKNVIDDTISFCEHRFKLSNTKLWIDTVPSHILVRGRATQLSQVLLNLLSNSLDAVIELKDRWVKVEVIEEKQNILIKVIDSGNGISSDLHEKIFQTFFTTKEVGKGTGLGLSISREILQDHGGSIKVDPFSKNTCFLIYIPRVSTEIAKEMTNNF